MKYAIIIPDGCADEPLESLGGKTPLQAAHTPAMDAVVASGVVGFAHHVPPHLPAGSDVANMSLLGYNPNAYFTGRAPLEAAAQGIALGPDDWAVRCNLVTIEDQTMQDFTAGHISTDEARQLLASLQERLENERLELAPGVSYRNLLLFRGAGAAPPFSPETRTVPPHDLTGQAVVDSFPRGAGSDLLNQIMSLSIDVFAGHPVNKARLAAGKRPATNVWLWGLGRTPKLPSFSEQYQKTGRMITAVDLLRGLAALVGWPCIEAPGATGYTDTDYASKGRCAIAAIAEADVVCVHIEAPDEASHEGEVAAKIKAIEQIDQHVVGPLHAALRAGGEHRILVTPDHPTSIATKTHTHGAVPFALAGTGVEPDRHSHYNEVSAAEGEAFPDGWKVMARFLG